MKKKVQTLPQTPTPPPRYVFCGVSAMCCLRVHCRMGLAGNVKPRKQHVHLPRLVHPFFGRVGGGRGARGTLDMFVGAWCDFYFYFSVDCYFAIFGLVRYLTCVFSLPPPIMWRNVPVGAVPLETVALFQCVCVLVCRALSCHFY